MSPPTLDEARRHYAERLLRGIDGNTQRLREAFATTAREAFVGAPPWPLLGHEVGRVFSDDPRDLYSDVLVGLDVERGINNGQPSLHARCLAACDPRPGETVLHIGAGTGYYSAILAQLVGAHGRVIAYEIEADLAARAAANLGPWPQASVHAASGVAPPLPPADVIYVNAGATHPVAAWLDAMRDGARLIFPLTPDDSSGCMLLVTRLSGGRYAACSLMRVAFIGCVGARDVAASTALRRAFASGNVDAVRALHRDDDPDASAWCAGPGWWLSTRSP
ncbi:MAG TPA: protein-L-isoaspartate(D-aspartate) O-methyltransferase [Burkholderiaceae bacterium]|nr:protein-L-isoaspartate(D-aspartate) O-methyltransferase [Burkholderiaceae bacterium]